MNVLLITSDSFINNAVKWSLKKDTRCRLLKASSAKDARELLYDIRIAVILLDIRMLDECTLFVFPNHHVHFLVVGIIPAKTERFEKTVSSFRARGAADIIRYPFNSEEIVMRVQTVYRLRNMLLRHERMQTKYHIIQEHLEACSNRLSAISNSIPAGIVVIDPETHVILDANTTAIILIGTDGDRVIGRICHQYICPAERGACPITDKGQNIDQSERILVNAHGEKIPILKTVTRVNLDGNDCLIEMFLDIRAQKKAEAERNALIEQLQQALQEVKTLSGLLPICASCKKIRDDQGYWNEIELYLEEHANAQFTHGICPSCMERLYPDNSG